MTARSRPAPGDPGTDRDPDPETRTEVDPGHRPVTGSGSDAGREPGVDTGLDSGLDSGLDRPDRAAVPPGRLSALRRLVGQVKDDARRDNITLIAAGVAFFSLISIAPALAALVGIYGIFADPADITQQISDTGGAMPADARSLLTDQLTSLTQSSSTGLSLSVVIGLLLALWGASTAVMQLFVAVSAMDPASEDRGYVRTRGRAIAFTLAAIVFFVIAISLTAVVPAVVDHLGAGEGLRSGLSLLRWVVLVALFMGALAVVYRFAPNREEPRWRWASWGAVVATVVWIAASILFSVYVTNFGNYNQTYGAMAAVVIFLLWLYLTALCVLLGAEIDAVRERLGGGGRSSGSGRPDPAEGPTLPG